MLPRGSTFQARIRRGKNNQALEERRVPFRHVGGRAAPAEVQREKELVRQNVAGSGRM